MEECERFVKFRRINAGSTRLSFPKFLEFEEMTAAAFKPAMLVLPCVKEMPDINNT